MPDSDAGLIARGKRACKFLRRRMHLEEAETIEAFAARLTAMAEERDALEANRSNGWAAANAEIAKRERAEASLTAAAEDAAKLRAMINADVPCEGRPGCDKYDHSATCPYADFAQQLVYMHEKWQRAEASITAAAERERLLTRLLRECQQTGAIGEYLDAAIDETFDMFAAAPADRAEPSAAEVANATDTAGYWRDARKLDAAQPPDADERETQDALHACRYAMTDWLHTYADDLCDPARVQLAYERIANGGGTLAYIARVQRLIDAAMGATP